MRKALIYGLTLTFALTLTACGQPKAEEPGAPDPAASMAVQPASPEGTTEPTATPEPSEETPPAPEEVPVEQPPEIPGETETTQPTGETEPTAEPEVTPTTKPTQASGSNSTQTTQPSGTGDTLAGESNSSDDDSDGGGSSPIGSTTLTPAEQAIRDKFLRDRENLNTGDGTHVNGQDMDEMLEYYFGDK